MAYHVTDYKITMVEKSCSVEKTTTTWQRIGSDGQIHNSSSDSYDTTILTRITYENGDVDIVEADLAVLEGSSVKFIYSDDKIFAKICNETKLILFHTDLNKINTNASESLIKDFYGEDSSNKCEEKILEYNLPENRKYYLRAKDQEIIKAEKISIIIKNGDTQINTRIYYSDFTNELYEDEEIPALPGWHARTIYFGSEANEKDCRHHKFIIESNYLLRDHDVYDEKHFYTIKAIYQPILTGNWGHARITATKNAEKPKVRIKTLSKLNTLLFFVSLIGIYFYRLPIVKLANILINGNPDKSISKLTNLLNILKPNTYALIPIIAIILSITFIFLLIRAKGKIKMNLDKEMNQLDDEAYNRDYPILKEICKDYYELRNQNKEWSNSPKKLKK